ncbi:GGDEF domain-containing protein [Iodobacter ciconiae]|uniref:diguanylate cyclase n=1 Tax=Iodobacter ciconiae TaxID=2496266 RepID=A0A3S8ZQI8_9NEIS|nr:GGDEF domain-containing protein [Iodobacter ciconiae]AZN35738.1 GGDEF domain-containing protein [Iodobacter ciconiae]
MKQALISLTNTKAIVLLLLYLGIGLLGIQFATLPQENFAVIGFASGCGLVIILELGKRGIPLVLSGSAILNTHTYYHFLTHSNTRYALPLSLILGLIPAAIDCWQSVMAARAWQTFIKKNHHPPLQTPGDLPYFWKQICFMPAAISMMLWHALLTFSSTIPYTSLLSNLQQMILLIIGDTAGIFIIAPIYASWKSGELENKFRPALPYFTALLFIVALGILVHNYLMMLVLPVLLLIAIHFRLAGTSVALFIVFTLSMMSTAYQTGPFTHANQIISFINLQLFLFSVGLTLHYLALLQELLSHSKIRLEFEVAIRTEALAAANLRLEELVTTDELTGVTNRREWQRRCDEAITYARRYQQPLSILLIDIDHFKNVNDHHGHLAGDLTLKELCRVCSAELRATDSFARWGGEEFVLLLPGTTQTEAMQAGNKLRLAVEELARIRFEDKEIRITISIGVAMLEDSDPGLDCLLNRADQAMYAAKAAGRNQVQCAPHNASCVEL